MIEWGKTIVMDTAIDNQVLRLIKELSESKRVVVFICNSDFSDFWSLWLKVIEKLGSLDGFKVRKRHKVFVLPVGNSDGKVSHDETCNQTQYFLTKN